MSDLDCAIRLACAAHHGQTDKSGAPYILHPLRLMFKFHDEEHRIVSVLHDVVEDSTVSFEDLARAGFSEKTVAALCCLTKQEGELYDDFIARLASNELARRVKIEDVKDNLDVTRLPLLTNSDVLRIEKYHHALRYLEQYSLTVDSEK